jgi:hypothetical protein
MALQGITGLGITDEADGMKQEIMMWAVINNVTQEVVARCGDPSIHNTRDDARWFCNEEKLLGNTAARVRRVKVTIEEAE